MPNPKHRHSKTRNRRTRAIWARRVATAKSLVKCTNPSCRAIIPAHQVCPDCGMYRGEKVVVISKEE